MNPYYSTFLKKEQSIHKDEIARGTTLISSKKLAFKTNKEVTPTHPKASSYFHYVHFHQP